MSCADPLPDFDMGPKIETTEATTVKALGDIQHSIYGSMIESK